MEDIWGKRHTVDTSEFSGTVANPALIVGLGNPGEKYQWTRHNAAWILFDAMHGPRVWHYEKNFEIEYYHTEAFGRGLYYVKPQLMMNRSGEPVKRLMDEGLVSNEGLLVIHDDIDLPFPDIRIAHDRGSAGHNGVESITRAIGSQEFTRIRIGVSHKDDGGNIHKPDVLSNFPREAREKLISRAGHLEKIILYWLTHTPYDTMNEFNGWYEQ